MMNPRQKIAGIAGIVAGLGLVIEGALFMTSGWTATTFGDSQSAITFLVENGNQLRMAVFAGITNLVFATVFIVGLSARISDAAPTRASATRYFGLIGIAGHSLVPLGLWMGVPMLINMAGADYQTAVSAWSGYVITQTGAGAVGSLFLGLSALAAGWAIASKTTGMPLVLGWVGIVLGVASVLTVLTVATPLSALASAAYFPALMLAIVFRTWTGFSLWRDTEETPTRTAHSV